MTIDNNVGLSQTAIICHNKITNGNDVKIGGVEKIYETAFHLLASKIRASKEDMNHKVLAPVIIKNKVFIGAYCKLLKGVVIGVNSIMGVRSVVTKSLPDNQVWLGNPAKLIRKI